MDDLKKSNMRSSSQSNETEKYIRITDDWSLDMYFCGGRQDTANNYRVPRGKVKLGILTVTNKETSRMMDGSIPQLCQPLLIIKSIVCQAW